MANRVLQNIQEIIGDKGISPASFKLTINVLAADIVDTNTFVVAKFSAFAQQLITSLLSAVQTGLDSNAVETLTFSLGIGDADGVIDIPIITDGDVVTEETEHLPETTTPRYLDCAGRCLILQFTAAAATAAPGTIVVRGGTDVGVLGHEVDLSN